MPTNQEWLHKLANESPDELKAWFDAEHFECPSDAGEAAIMSVDAFIAEHNDNLAAENDVSGVDVDSNDAEADTREKLEADVRSSLGFTTKDVFEWLDRQAAITKQQIERKWCCYEDSVQAEIDRLQRRNDELRTSYDKLKSERDNLADDLLACNREREQLRKHLGIALDHAHDICSLVDIDGNVLDVGD